MANPLDSTAINRLFSEAHTTHTFTEEPVDPALIQQAYEDLRWAPTGFNAQPLRLTVLTPGASRDAVVEHLMDSNKAKTKAAPLTVVAAYTADWHEHMPTLAPQRDGARESFEKMAKMRETVGQQSALIQIGYLLLALRARGLEVGPMTGLDAEGVDQVVHADNGWKTLVVINVGHAADPHDESAVRPRGGRLEFAQAAQVL
ncbi:malonic semialdehyde reductase [Nesterenkonia flava]|uniref:Malonic semialdehyde reductase n=1 Tax=Nesterenkonia flava TaxID=469799 RepID=A0ABU1FVW0_9MICC|nr:malonic semialdehyde reductase [Nesterenkonia flava]MDR5712821.1 malonic semialdehyde reductase [Nesterenkonia flava]